MSAGHAPHTSPPWREVLSLPHTRFGWWAVGLAGPALVLGVFFQLSVIFDWTFLRPEVVAQTGSADQYPLLMLAWALSAVAGGVVGLIALARDRSALVWVAQAPGLIVFAYLIWAVSSMLMGKDANLWITLPSCVLVWAVSAFLICMRKSGESR